MDKTNNNSSENNILLKVRNKFILKKIFDNLKLKLLLQLIIYNKEIQSKANIDINDYIDYAKIVIEIIPKENQFGKFINFFNDNSKYYHIYLNNNKKGVELQKIKKEDKISKIKIKIDNQIKSLYKLFHNCKCIKAINFLKFNIEDIEDMNYMFCGCESLEKINFYNICTNNVKDMSYMFDGCLLLKDINFSRFNTD